MRGLTLRHGLAGAAAVVAALAVGAGVARADHTGTLSLQVIPSSLISGGPGWVFATFQNTGHSTLNNVIVNVDLGGATLDASGTDAACIAAGSGVSCSLGTVRAGGVVVSTIAFTAPGSAGPLTIGGTATWDAKTNGNPGNSSNHTSTDSATATVSDISATLGESLIGTPVGRCVTPGESPVSSGGIDVTGNSTPAGLPCQPLVVGTTTLSDGPPKEQGQPACVALFAKVPGGTTASAKLTFTDGCLPWPDSQDTNGVPSDFDANAGYFLYENVSFPTADTEVIVPPCNSDGSVPTSGSYDSHTASTDACVVSVTANDTVDSDSDAGSILLNLKGSAGDGGFHPG